MKTPERVLSVTHAGDEVSIHADIAGLDFLIGRLQSIRNKLAHDECEHEHLMTESWGGWDLSESIGPKRDGWTLVHHVQLNGWTAEWAAKHGFKAQ